MKLTSKPYSAIRRGQDTVESSILQATSPELDGMDRCAANGENTNEISC